MLLERKLLHCRRPSGLLAEAPSSAPCVPLGTYMPAMMCDAAMAGEAPRAEELSLRELVAGSRHVSETY